MWEFHSSHDARRWGWKHFLAGKLQQLSGPVFATMTEALHDAGTHGFEMHRHRWDVAAV